MKVKLRDVTKYSKGTQINGDDLPEDGEYVYMNGGINPSGRWNSANVKGNTVTISEGGNSSGYVNYITKPFWCGAHCYYLFDGPENTRYLYYALKSQQQRLFGIRSGACMPNIKKADLGKFEFEFDTDEQKQKEVVSALLKVESVIIDRKRELELLEDLIKARFIEMFGDPVANPKRLIKKTLPELGEFGRGVSKHRPRNDETLLGGPHPLIQTGDVANSGLYITEHHSTYSELGLQQSKMWDEGTLCITIAANIAKTAILGFDACFPDSIVGFIANEDTNNVFVHYWFSFFQEILESQAPESAQKNINLKILSELKVIVPNIQEQNEFADFVVQVEKTKDTIRKSLDETQILLDSLMQRYFG